MANAAHKHYIGRAKTTENSKENSFTVLKNIVNSCLYNTKSRRCCRKSGRNFLQCFISGKENL